MRRFVLGGYGVLIAIGDPAASPISFDVAAPGLFPPGSLLFVEPSTATLFGPAPMGSFFCFGGPPILDPSLWGTVVAMQAFTVASGLGGATVLRATNGLVVALGV